MDKLLSLCMIVKNEEKTLARCLDSVKGVADEIIVVDTGSTDRTKEIAAEYTTHIYDFTWINDFAAAKNEAIRHATGKWILVLDADEYLQPGQEQEMLTFLQQFKVTKPVALITKIMNFQGESMEKITSFLESSAARIFVNHQGIIFERPIHEQLTGKKGSLHFQHCPFVILHTGYVTETVNEKNKSERNMSIFENYRSKDPYDNFTLANEHRSLGDHKKALYGYKKALQKSKPHQLWIPYCYEGLIISLFAEKQFKESYDSIRTCLRMWPNYVDFHFFLGDLYFVLGFNDLAAKQLASCLELAGRAEKEGKQASLVRLDYAGYLPSKVLANIYVRRNDWANAVFYLTKAISINNSEPSLLYQLLTILARTEAADSIYNLLEKLVPCESSASNASMLFRLSMMVGHLELADKYLAVCKSLQVQLGTLDSLHYSLLTKDQTAFSKHCNALERLDDDSAIRFIAIAVLVWKRPDYYIDMLPAYVQHQVRQLTTGEHSHEESVEPTNEQLTWWNGVLQEMFKLGFHEQMDHIVAYLQSPGLYQSLADFIYSLGQPDMAIDYYSLLLENGLLHFTGYQNLATLYLQLGEIEQGLEFVEAAIKLSPGYIPLYIQYCTFSPDPSKKAEIKAKLLSVFPECGKLPFVDSL